MVTKRQPPFRDGTLRLRFVLQVAVAERDRPVLVALREILAFGSIRAVAPRKSHHQPMAVFTINSIRAHRAATIPFCDAHLLPCAKREQYERWRAALDQWEAEHPSRYGKGPSPCSVPGCELPVRGRGLCRRHYYRATGY